MLSSPVSSNIFVIKKKCNNKRPNRFITIKSTKLLKADIVLSVEC